MPDEDAKKNQSDHDTLIKIETKLDALTTEVKSGNDDTRTRITQLGENKVEKDAFHAWQITHERESNLREEALKKEIADTARASEEAAKANSDDIKSLQTAVAKQTKQLTYVAGGLFVLGIILSLIGPVISAAITRALHLG